MRLKIQAKIMLGFFIAGILPALILTSITYYISISILKKQISERLNDVADQKIEAVKRFDITARQSVVHIAGMPEVVETLKKARYFPPPAANSKEYLGFAGKYDGIFRNYIGAHPCYDILLISRNGMVVYSLMKENDLGKVPESMDGDYSLLASCIKKIKATKMEASTNIGYYPPSKQFSLFYGAPILDNKKDLIGILVMQYAGADFKALTRGRLKTFVHPIF